MSDSRERSLIARLGGRVMRTRWFVRAPIGLYKGRLGWLLGSRTCMIEHIGRKTGRRRYVVIEVVDRPTPDTLLVASGFGTRAQWYRNVVANPSVRVWIGGHAPRAAVVAPLPAEEATAALARYAKRHPRSWAALRQVFEDLLGEPVGEDGSGLPLLRIDLR